MNQITLVENVDGHTTIIVVHVVMSQWTTINKEQIMYYVDKSGVVHFIK